MARRTKEDAEKTKESLLDAAEKVFLRRGVSRSTLEEIAKEAGVTRGAVYWHFENKIAIIRAMHDRVKLPLDLMFEKLTGGDDPLEGLKAMCVHVFDALERDEHARNVFTILRLRCEGYQCDDSPEAEELRAKRRDVCKRFANVFTQIAKHHPLSPNMTPEIAAIALHSFISGVLWDYLTLREDYPLGKAAPQLVDTFFHGMLRPV